MKHIVRIICGASLVALSPGLGLHAQGTFMKSYAADTVGGASGIATLPDGGFMLAGYVKYSSQDRRLALARLDSLGVLQWSREYANIIRNPKLVALSSGDLLVLAGTAPLNAEDLLVMRLDAVGDTLWTRVFEHEGIFMGAFNAVEMPNGDLILASYDAYVSQLTRLTAQGSIVWSRGYEGDPQALGGLNEFTMDVILTSDSAVVVCGQLTTNDGSIQTHAYLEKSDLNGNLIWARLLRFDLGQNAFTQVVETADGGYLAVGSHSSGAGPDPMVVRTDAGGNVLWRKIFGAWDRVNILERCPDGNYLLGGLGHHDLQAVFQGFLFKISDAGDVIWSHAYGSDLYFSDGVLMDDRVGIAATHVVTGSSNMVLCVADSSGMSDCDVSPYPLVASDIILDEIDVVYPVSGVSVRSSDIELSPLPLIESVQCLPEGIQEDAGMGAFSVYPNPAGDHCFIRCPAGRSISSVEVVDAQGRTVTTYGRDLSAPLDVSRLRPGIYLFRIFTADRRGVCERVVLE